MGPVTSTKSIDSSTSAAHTPKILRVVQTTLIMGFFLKRNGAYLLKQTFLCVRVIYIS